MEFKGFIRVNRDYLDYLREYDYRVEEKEKRPNISVLVDKNGQLWAIPMSRREYIRNDGSKTGEAFYNLYHKERKTDGKEIKTPLGRLIFNNMIPISNGTYTTLNYKTLNYDYVSMLEKQRKIILSEFENIQKLIENRLSREYKESDQDNEYLRMYANLDKILQKSKNWEFVHNKHNEIINKFTNDNVSLSVEDLENLNQDIIKLGKKDFVKVYEYSNVLKENNYEFDVIKKYIQQENVSIFLQKQNNVKDIKIKSFSDYKQEIAIQRKEEEMVKANIIRRQEKVPRLKNIFLDKNKSNSVNMLNNKETIKEKTKTSAKTNKQYDYEREK